MIMTRNKLHQRANIFHKVCRETLIRPRRPTAPRGKVGTAPNAGGPSCG
ncbi:hypothetical protein HMPREF1550_01793 [Actinomyces sp. oral taxon 877 str. F0543]|nr:hypothetical protein HMPREF1550_01793 [Actinomyces sp. oral taxon 877 str. F0543]